LMVKHSSFKTELEECLNLLQSLKQWEYHPIFAQPVDPVALGIPDYFDIVNHPMDLMTIEDRLRHNDYAHAYEFYTDLQLVWKNALLYNTEGEVREYALQLQDRCETFFKAIPKLSKKEDVPKCNRQTRHSLMDLMRGLGKKQFKQCFELVGNKCNSALVYNTKKRSKEKCCTMYVHRIDEDVASEILTMFKN